MEIEVVAPGHFEAKNHYYPRVLNAHLHPLVRYFMSLNNDRLINRYCHLHPESDKDAVRELLTIPTKYFRWGGADLLHTTTEDGTRRIVVIETNSCPSGQKSMPIQHEENEHGGYHRLLSESFLPMLKRRRLPEGALGVFYDKNYMEASGYAATMADVANEDVLMVPVYDQASNHLRVDHEGVVEVDVPGTGWTPIRAAFRYVTQKPWNRIPPMTRTLIYNPVLVCLAGGRNKLLAAKAYDFYQSELQTKGLSIHTPETIWDVAREQIPFWVERMGGFAVVKVPYSNAGQGVYTITNHEELDQFMQTAQMYDRYIVQGLIGNSLWSSHSSHGRFYHVGMIPDRRQRIFVADLRFMVAVSPEGFYPVALYARRARSPLVTQLDQTPSWDMLGTNLSVRLPEGDWTTETDRLVLMDTRDFNHLGIGLDDLIEAYVQTVIAVKSIDQMASNLMTRKGVFRRKFFATINPDRKLVGEIL